MVQVAGNGVLEDGLVEETLVLGLFLDDALERVNLLLGIRDRIDSATSACAKRRDDIIAQNSSQTAHWIIVMINSGATLAGCGDIIWSKCRSVRFTAFYCFAHYGTADSVVMMV